MACERVVGIELWQTQTLAGAVQAGDILPRTEKLHAAVGTAVGLQPLKDLGAVVQDAGGGGERDGTVGHDARVVPALAGVVVHEEHMVGKDGAEAELIGRRQRAGMGIFGNSDIHNVSSFRVVSDLFEMLHIVANALAAGVEGRLFLVRERQLHDLLHAVRADDARHAGKEARSRRIRRTAPRSRA